MSGHRLIGGFFGLELPQGGEGFKAFWAVRNDTVDAFENARSAFAALVDAINPTRVWLPAYICTELATAVPAGKLAFYPVDDRLSPDIKILVASAQPGDVVLAVNYFGRAPAGDFLAFVAQRPDLCVVEDCAQAIDTGVAPWGHWRLFSPRKLIGVPDGGLLVATRASAIESLPAVSTFDIATFEAPLRRFEDEAETQNAIWHVVNQLKETGAAVSRRRMCRLSDTLLGLLDPLPIMRRRKENFAELQGRLGSVAFLDDPVPDYVPFGFPIRVEDGRRDTVLKALSEAGIFAACHWKDLPSPTQIFVLEHRLAGELVTLPCDQRYGSQDMELIANTVEDTLS